MSARVEVVAVTDCPVCVPGWNWTDCEHCDGTTQVRRVVTCAGCRWWERDCPRAGDCRHPDVPIGRTVDTFGCNQCEPTEEAA